MNNQQKDRRLVLGDNIINAIDGRHGTIINQYPDGGSLALWEDGYASKVFDEDLDLPDSYEEEGDIWRDIYEEDTINFWGLVHTPEEVKSSLIGIVECTYEYFVAHPTKTKKAFGSLSSDINAAFNQFEKLVCKDVEELNAEIIRLETELNQLRNRLTDSVLSAIDEVFDGK